MTARKQHFGFRQVATTVVRAESDVRSFFDRCASDYREEHGHPEGMLGYRLGLVRAHARPGPDDVVLDLGCGSGHHLLALAPEIARGIGVDLSPAMIDVAFARLRASPWAARLAFEVGDAAALSTVADRSIDLALCIGALEHMLDRRATLASVVRVLKPGGRFFCLTPSGDYLWYRTIAPLLGIETRHLSTDRFLTGDELGALLAQAGFHDVDRGAWTFVPRGDMPKAAALAFDVMDLIGRASGLTSLRGGQWVCAWKR